MSSAVVAVDTGPDTATGVLAAARDRRHAIITRAASERGTMSADEPYPPGPPGTPAGPSDRYFEGLTYGRAWNAFWLGLTSMFCCGLITGIPAVFVGGRALSDIEASQGRLVGRGPAWVGIILGVLGTIGSAGGLTWYQMRH